jgi:hypothetical protein
MARYEVDVKAFFSVTVRAATEEGARRAADAFIESIMTAPGAAIAGYNDALPSDAVGRIVPLDVSASVNGHSDVTKLGEG